MANDDAVVCYLLSAVEPRLNDQLECERLVLWTFNKLPKSLCSFINNPLDEPLEDLPLRPLLSSTPMAGNKSQNQLDLAVTYSLREERFKVLHHLMVSYIYLFLTVQ